MSMLFRAVILLAAAVVAGCAGLLTGPEEPPIATYLLAFEAAAPERAGRGPTLGLAEPEAAAGYATRRMAYLERDYRVDYFAESEWVAAPADMLRPLLARALRATGRFGAVTEEGDGVDADLRLDILILHLHQDFRVRPSRGAVALRAELVDPSKRKVLASRLFEGEEPAQSEDAYGGVVAINRVLDRLLPQVAAFAAEAAGR